MIDRGRRRRIASAGWLLLAAVAWNGVYDLLLTRAVKECLLRAALYEAGRGPLIPISDILRASVQDAIWKSTVSASIVLVAGLLTIRYVGARAG